MVVWPKLIDRFICLRGSTVIPVKIANIRNFNTSAYLITIPGNCVVF
jgi:hypothetical protein